MSGGSAGFGTRWDAWGRGLMRGLSEPRAEFSPRLRTEIHACIPQPADTLVVMARRRTINKAKKTAYLMAALFPDRLSLDAAELIASRIDEIDGKVVEAIRLRVGGGRLEHEDVKAALDKAWKIG